MGANITRVGGLPNVCSIPDKETPDTLNYKALCYVSWISERLSENDNQLQRTYLRHSQVRYDMQTVYVENVACYFGPFTFLTTKIWVSEIMTLFVGNLLKQLTYFHEK